jgi:multidrug efflux pump subunit AcrA (membrane-fusion protein)
VSTRGVWLALVVFSCGKGGAVTYETTKVDKGRIAPKVTATGTLSALVTVQVGSQVSGGPVARRTLATG